MFRTLDEMPVASKRALLFDGVAFVLFVVLFVHSVAFSHLGRGFSHFTPTVIYAAGAALCVFWVFADVRKESVAFSTMSFRIVVTMNSSAACCTFRNNGMALLAHFPLDY